MYFRRRIYRARLRSYHLVSIRFQWFRLNKLVSPNNNNHNYHSSNNNNHINRCPGHVVTPAMALQACADRRWTRTLATRAVCDTLAPHSSCTNAQFSTTGLQNTNKATSTPLSRKRLLILTA